MDGGERTLATVFGHRWARLRIWAEEVADATGTGTRAALAAVGVAGVVLGALWWLSRQEAMPVEATLPLVDVAAVTTTSPPVSAPTEVVVHVAGAVRRPGVLHLGPGARIVDAIEASGGLAPDADVDRLNLAAPVVDGTRVYVPVAGEPVPEPIGGGGTPGDELAAGGRGTAGPIDVNVARAAELEALPGVGPATAAAIVEHRRRHGPFQTVDGLLAVRGIGEAKLAVLRDLVRV